MFTPFKSSQRSTWLLDTLLLIVVLGGVFFLLLGSRPLFVPDEGRYAEIAREMAVSGDYITPYLNGIKYFEKPVLFYWLETLSLQLAGPHLLPLRSVNALLGLLGCLLTYFTARQLYDRLTGLLAAFILGTSLLFFIMTQMISLDLTVTVFLAACLYTFLLGARTTHSTARCGYFHAAAISAALAVLTKGLIGIVFPAAIIGSWLLLTREWHLIRRFYVLTCLGLFLLIAAPWHVLVAVKNPEFAYFYFIEQHVLRYSTLSIGHYQPVWFFIPCLIAGFFPWIVFLPQALINAWPRSWQACAFRKTEVFFLLWAVLIFTFFSFSKSKLIPYLLPIFPALAVLTAHYLRHASFMPYRAGCRYGYTALCLFAAGIAYIVIHFLHHTVLPHPALAEKTLYLAIFFLLSGSVIAYVLVHKQQASALLAVLVTTLLFSVCLLAAVPFIDTRSILPLAEALKPLLKPQDKVITYNQYYQDLPFYLQRQIYIVNWRNELSYGSAHQAHHEWLIDDYAFWQLWHHQHCVFVIMSKTEYAKSLLHSPKEIAYPIKTTVNNILISNCKTD